MPATATEPYNAGMAGSSIYTITASKSLSYVYDSSNLFKTYILVAIPKGMTASNAPILSSLRLRIFVIRSRWDCKINFPADFGTTTYSSLFVYNATTDTKTIDLFEAFNIDVSDENYLNLKFDITSVTLSQDIIADLTNSTAPFTAQGLDIINKFQLVISVKTT